MNLTKEGKEEIWKGIEWKSYPDRPKGGQQVGIGIRGVTLKHPEFSFEISIGEFRSQSQNKEMCLTLFELFLGELLK